jgi:hypothetical protein
MQRLAAPVRLSTEDAGDRGPESAPLRVSWVGGRPAWTEIGAAADELGSVAQLHEPRRGEVGMPAPGAGAEVLHVRHAAAGSLRSLRRHAQNAAIVLDLTALPEGEAYGGARRCSGADLVLLPSLRDLSEARRRFPSVVARSALLRPPLERLEHGRSAVPEAWSSGPPFVLFDGPMTSAGGLDAALDAVESLDTPAGPLRLVALCRGRVERRFRERIVARATKAGERVLVAGGPLPASTVAAWYEAAAAVCLPATGTLDPTPAKLAAVAGKPCVVAEVDSLLEYVDDETGILVPVHDVGGLRRALGLLVRDDELAARLGAVARRRADEELAPAAAARRLRHLWETVAHARVAANGHRRAGTANGARAR